jgi:hypothetical protein
MNFLSWGLDFLYKQAEQFTDVDLLIGYPGQPQFEIKGTISECKHLLDSGAVKTQAPRFHIMVPTQDLAKYEISLVRGLQILNPATNVTYELVLDAKGSYFYNDGEHRRTVLVMNEKGSPC